MQQNTLQYISKHYNELQNITFKKKNITFFKKFETETVYYYLNLNNK